jgi:hypothetical protein
VSVRRSGHGTLELGDWLNGLAEHAGDRALLIGRGAASVRVTAIDRESDQRVELHLGTAELDALAAEILTLRDEMDI